jgi:phytol kinase
MPLGYGDGFAAIIGEKVHFGVYRIFNSRKSIAGNTAMFIMTFFVIVIYNLIYSLEYSIFQLILISFASTVVEAISIKGTDNLTIPILTYTIFIITS